jgi:transcription initiation factor TFIID subunit TAF12
MLFDDDRYLKAKTFRVGCMQSEPSRAKFTAYTYTSVVRRIAKQQQQQQQHQQQQQCNNGKMAIYTDFEVGPELLCVWSPNHARPAATHHSAGRAARCERSRTHSSTSYTSYDVRSYALCWHGRAEARS